MEYQINCGAWGQLFAVPNCVADHFLKLASPDALRVLLYALRHGNEQMSGKEIADAVGCTEDAVEEAFCFWKQANVLGSTGAQPVPAQSKPPAPQSQPQPVSPAPEPKAFAQRSSAGFAPTPSELAGRIEAEQAVRDLFGMAENLYRRLLTPTEQRSLLWMRDYLGLDADVILMLLGYCISVDKAHVRYTESVAVSWLEQGITTFDAAQSEVARLTAQQTFTAQIMRAFDMKRRPTPKQQTCIDLWQQKGYAMELITYAYEKTIESIEKLSFSYIAKILENWEAAGYKDRSAVDAAASSGDKRGEHSYDLNEYKSLMNSF